MEKSTAKRVGTALSGWRRILLTDSLNISIGIRSGGGCRRCIFDHGNSYPNNICGRCEHRRYRSLLDYFEDNYIGRSRRGRARAQPKFPIGLWNVVSRTEMDLPRTNNNVEGWHNRFSSIINGAHPTLRKFLENLKTEEILSRAETAQILGGHQFPAKKKYADSAKRVKKLVSEYPSRSSNVVSYLRGIAHNLKF